MAEAEVAKGAPEETLGPNGQRLVKARPRATPPADTADERYHFPDDDVPADIADPAARKRPTIGRISLTRDAIELPLDVPGASAEVPDFSDTTLRSLEDLMAAFPIGDGSGQYFIRVDRKAPNAYHGLATKGLVKKIRTPLTLEEFIQNYGGGTYELIVYGPPKRGGLLDPATGLVRPKALSTPIRFTIPYLAGGHPPNPDAAYDDDDEQSQENETMTERESLVPRILTTRGATPANARMLADTLSHEERKEQRRREDRSQRVNEERNTQAEALKLVSEAHRDRAQDMREENRRLNQKIEEGVRAKGSDLDGLAAVLKEVMPKAAPPTEVHALRDHHQREIERMDTLHKQELDNIRRASEDALARMQASARADVERGEQRLKMTEDAARLREADLERRIERERKDQEERLDRTTERLRQEHTRDMDTLRSEHQRQMASQKEVYEVRLQGETRQVERDATLRAQTMELQLVAVRTPLEGRLLSVESELRRVEAERDRLRTELDKKGDIGKQIEVVARQAELLGFVKDEGGASDAPTDWKGMLTAVGTKVAEKFPEILQAAGAAAANLRNPPQQQAQPQMMRALGPSPLPMQGVTQPPPVHHFMTEDSGASPPPLAGDYAAPGPRAVQPPVIERSVPPPPPPPMAQQQAIVAQEPFPTPAPTPSAPPPPPRPQIDPAQVDQVMLQAGVFLEDSYLQSRAPADVAAMIVAQQGKDQVRVALPMFTAESVSQSLQRIGKPNSPLVKRKGQRYLRSLYAALEAATKGEQA